MITDLKGFINSPGYPVKYPDNIDCYWTVHRPYDKIKLTFLDFKLLSSPHDYVEVMEGPFSNSRKLMHHKYGSVRPYMDHEYADRWLWIHFKTDQHYGAVGFHALHDLYMKRVPIKQDNNGKIQYLN